MRSVLDFFSKKLFLIATTICLFIVMNSAYADDSIVQIFKGDYTFIIGLVFVILEFILGRTDKIKSGSTLELVLRTILGILEKLTGKKQSSLIQDK